MSWFSHVDAPLRGITTPLKIPEGNVSKYLLPEAAGLIVEIPIDMAATGLGGKLTKLGVAAIIEAVNSFTDVFKAKNEISVMNSYLGIRALDPTPADLVQLANTLTALVTAAQTGNWAAVPTALGFNTPDTITANVKAITDAWNRFAATFVLPSLTLPSIGTTAPTPPPTLTYAITPPHALTYLAGGYQPIGPMITTTEARVK